jgi:hypothetical protein
MPNRARPVTTVIVAAMLMSCSKSPIDSTVSTANALAAQWLAPLVQKDASHQVEGLIRTLDDRPDCQIYIERLREAGHG